MNHVFEKVERSPEMNGGKGEEVEPLFFFLAISIIQ